MLMRFFRHLACAYWRARGILPAGAQDRLADAIERAEQGHAGEICFVIETSLTPLQLIRRMSARERSLELFADLHVWDTANNSGVLIYLLLADHAVEILADRGLHPRGDLCWSHAAERIRQGFQAGDASAGCIDAVSVIGDFLRREFPASGPNPDELPNPIRRL